MARRKDPDRVPVIDDALRVLPNRFILDHKRIRAAVPRARRFMLSDEASLRLGEIMGATEDIILANQQFALAPFPTTYIELNCRLLYVASGKRTLTVNDKGQTIYEPAPAYRGDIGVDHSNNPNSDNRCGYLLDRGMIWTFSRQLDGSLGMAPWRFEDSLGHPDGFRWPSHLSPQARLIGPVWGPLSLMLGSGLHYLDADSRAAIRARFSMHKALPEAAYDKWQAWMFSAGDVRNIIAVLLLLNTPNRVTLVAQQPRVVFASGRRMVYAAHHTVEIELGRVKDMRRLWRHHSDRESPRRHEVRGHFAHFHGKSGCVHDWPLMPVGGDADSPKWQCSRCGCLRVWREAYQRGDASKGFVTKDYEVVR